MKSRRKQPPPSRRQRLALLLPGFVLVLCLGAYFLIPYLLTDGIPRILGNRLQRQVTVGEADFSLLPLRLTLRHGIVGPRENEPNDTVDPLLSFSELSMTFDGKALLKGDVLLERLTLSRPFFHLVLQKDGSSNLATLLNGFGDQQPFSLPRLFTTLLQIAPTADIDIDNGRLQVDDTVTGKQHHVEKIVVRLPAGSVATAGGELDAGLAGRAEISAVVNGNPVSLAGRQTTTPEGPALSLRLQMNDTDLLPYLPYIPSVFGYRILAGKGNLLLDCLVPRQRQGTGSIQLATALELSGLRMQDADATEISIGSLALAGRYIPAGRQLIVTSLKIEQPSFSIVRQADGKWFFPGRALFPEGQQRKNGTYQWRIDELLIRQGTVLLTDLAVEGGFTEHLEGFALSLHDLHPAGSQRQTTITLQAKTRRNSTITLEGKGQLSSFSGSGMLVADHLQLPALAPYLTGIPATSVLKEGSIEKAKMTFSFSKTKDGGMAFSLGGIDLLAADLNLTAGKSSYRLPSVKINDASLDFPARRLMIGQLDVADLQATLPQLDLPPLDSLSSPSAAEQNGPNESHWQTSIRQASLHRATVRITGSAPENPRVFSFSNTRIVNLDDQSNQGGRISGLLSFSKKGTLHFAGQLFLAPLRTELQVVLDNLPLAEFPELWNSWLTIPVRTGMLHAKGEMRLPDFSFTGSFDIADLTAGKDSPTIAWQQLLAENCSLAVHPLSLSIRNVTLDRPYLQWLLFEQNRPNIEDLLKKDSGSQDHRSVKISDITVHQGRLDYANHAISPPYVTRCEEINGTIDSVSNTTGSRSHLTANGMLTGEAPLSLEGNFGFFDPQFYADFTADLGDLELLPLSPYTENILGYTLRDGRLDLRARFHLERGVLTADNNLKINNLKLGRQLQNLSQLPLTIALLTDPHGTIELSVPVRGNTADPSFSFRSSFLDTFQNLLLRTAVSPFSVFNALIPKRNALDLDHISFGFGEAKLSEKSADQVAEIAQAVKLRPWLAIAIQGQADAKTDLDTLVVRQKQQTMTRELQQERQISRHLSSEYGNEVIDLQNLKDANRPLQEQTNQSRPPGERELVALAKERAQEVYQTLLQQGVATRQLRLVDRILIIGADAASHTGNRVSLSLESILPL